MSTSYIPFGLFFAVGMIFPINGVIVGEAALRFSTDIATIGFTSTLFIALHTLALAIGGFLIDLFGVRTAILIGFGLIMTACAWFLAVPGLFSFAGQNALSGFGTGLLIAGGNFMALHLGEASHRSSRLNMMNVFFGVASLLTPAIGSFAIHSLPMGWDLLFWVVLCLALTMSLVSLKIPAAPAKDNNPQGSVTDVSDIPRVSPKRHTRRAFVGFVLACLFMYVFSEFILTYWIVTWGKLKLGMPIESAGLLLSVFWGGIAFGRFLAGILVRRVGERVYLIVSTFLGIVSLIGVLISPAPAVLFTCAGTAALAFSGIYPTLIGFGTGHLPVVSGKMMTLFITIGPIGGITALPLSSGIQGVAGLPAAFSLGLAGFVCLGLLLTAAFWAEKRITRRA